MVFRASIQKLSKTGNTARHVSFQRQSASNVRPPDDWRPPLEEWEHRLTCGNERTTSQNCVLHISITSYTPIQSLLAVCTLAKREEGGKGGTVPRN